MKAAASIVLAGLGDGNDTAISVETAVAADMTDSSVIVSYALTDDGAGAVTGTITFQKGSVTDTLVVNVTP